MNEERLWDIIKGSNLWIIGAPEGEGREIGEENLIKKKMTDNFPNQRRDLDIQVHEVQRYPNELNSKRSSPKHIYIKTVKQLKTKRESKNQQEKRSFHLQGNPKKAISRFIRRKLTGQEDGDKVFKPPKEKILPIKNALSSMLSFRNKGEIKTFTEKQKMRSSSPLYLPYKKCWRKFFKLK